MYRKQDFTHLWCLGRGKGNIPDVSRMYHFARNINIDIIFVISEMYLIHISCKFFISCHECMESPVQLQEYFI